MLSAILAGIGSSMLTYAIESRRRPISHLEMLEIESMAQTVASGRALNKSALFSEISSSLGLPASVSEMTAEDYFAARNYLAKKLASSEN